MVVNPDYTDFKSIQVQGITYKDTYYPSDILRAISNYFKYLFSSKPDIGYSINAIAYGLHVTADYDDENKLIKIYVNKGAAVLDNQPIEFLDDMRFDIDDPEEDKIFYVYFRYQYVDEYPPNYAIIEILDTEHTGPGYVKLAEVHYNNSDHGLTIKQNEELQSFKASHGLTVMSHVPTVDEITDNEIVLCSKDNNIYVKAYDSDNNPYIKCVTCSTAAAAEKHVNNLLGFDIPEYDSDTVYQKGDIIKDSYGAKYISLVNGNQGNSLTDSSKWSLLKVYNNDNLFYYDKLLDERKIIDMQYDDNQNLSLIRYDGDDDSSVYYRSVMSYDSEGKLSEVKYYFNNPSNGDDDWNGKLSLSYDDNDNLIATNYEEQ